MTERTPTYAELLERVYGAERDYRCDNGHEDCATFEGGRCAGETLSALCTTFGVEPTDDDAGEPCPHCGGINGYHACDAAERGELEPAPLSLAARVGVMERLATSYEASSRVYDRAYAAGLRTALRLLTDAGANELELTERGAQLNRTEMTA